MKIKTSALAISLFAVTAFLKIPQAAFALELLVNDRGTVVFYEDGVLGENTETKNEQKKAETKKAEVKRVEAAKDKRIEIKAKQDKVEVRVAGEDEAHSQNDILEAKRLRAQFATQRLSKVTELTPDENQDASGRKLSEAEKEYRHKLEVERRENEDALEVKSKLDAEGNQELELQNNAIRAGLRGADFSFNPETNTVTLTTPSGEEKELNHLPDQALERINAVISVQSADPANPDVSIETTSNGALYHTTTVKRKKLLGLFDREIKTQVILDDVTGEVATIDQKSPGILGQLFDAFSF